MLARGLGGVLNGEKSLAFLYFFKFGLLIGGVYVLSLLFPEQRTSLILGCSTWVVATLMLGQPKPVASVETIILFLTHSALSNRRSETK